MPADDPFVLPHTGPQTFTIFSYTLDWTLAAFKAIDVIRVASKWCGEFFYGLIPE